MRGKRNIKKQRGKDTCKRDEGGRGGERDVDSELGIEWRWKGERRGLKGEFHMGRRRKN